MAEGDEVINNYVDGVIKRAVCEAEEEEATRRTTTSKACSGKQGKLWKGVATAGSGKTGRPWKGGQAMERSPSLGQGCSGGSGQRPRSRSPTPGGQRVPIMRGGVPVHQRETVETSTVDELKGKIDQVATAVSVVAQAVADQVRKSSITTVEQQAITRLAPPASSIGIRVPRPTAHHLNEALLKAVQSSQQMRQALEIYEKAARGNEALLELAQRALSNLLCD